MSTLSTIAADIITVFKNDELKTVAPMLGNFLNSIAANPTALNIAAQAALLNSQVIAAQTDIGQDVLKSLASLVNTQVQALVAAQAPAATPAATA